MQGVYNKLVRMGIYSFGEKLALLNWQDDIWERNFKPLNL